MLPLDVIRTIILVLTMNTLFCYWLNVYLLISYHKLTARALFNSEGLDEGLIITKRIRCTPDV